MNTIDRIQDWNLWRAYVLGLVIWSASFAESALAITAPPAWKFPVNIAIGASHDNQRGDRFLAFDHYGVPSAVAANAGGSVLFVRQADGVGWRLVVLGGSNSRHASLAFDRRELPAVVYGNDAGLNYTYFSPTTMNWQNNIVDNRNFTLGTGIAFDVYGRPAVAASLSPGGGMFYASDSNLDGVLSSADTLETVSNGPEQFPSLVFDRQNRPLIGSRYLQSGPGPGGDLDVWMKDPFLDWQLTVVSLAAEPGTPDAVTGSMAIDPTDGQPAVAWSHFASGTGDSELHYAKWNQLLSQWDETTITIDSANQLGNESLAFDPSDGRPAISYGDDSGNVNIAWFDGSIWNTQLVFDTPTSFAPRTSLAFNEFGHGFPAIAYITNTGGGAGSMFFVVDPPAAVPEPNAAALCAVGALAFAARRRRPPIRFTY